MSTSRWVLILLLLTAVLLNAQKANPEVGITEKLGQTVPLDLTFYDENGKEVILKDLVDKPTVLAFVYYRCPGICGPLMNGIQMVLEKIEIQPGKDFQVITISFDPKETHIMASRKKQAYLKAMKRKLPDNAWRFLTAKEENIRKLTAATGFFYKKEDGEYRHAGSLIVLAPKTGKITRYLYGLTYPVFDLQMAIVEASQGRVGPTIAKMLRYCYSYDPKGKKYALNIVRISGTIIFTFVFVFLLLLIIKGKKTQNQRR